MDRERHQRLYALHSWTGITLGWFLYLVVYSGCVALFHEEIRTWEDPARRIELSEERAPMQPALEAFVAEASAGRAIRFVSFDFANEIEPYHTVRVGLRDAGGSSNAYRRFVPATGAPLPEHSMGLSKWLVEFHRSLSWPGALGGFRVGRTLIGIAGLALMLSVLTGWWIHTKRVPSLFVLRADRSDRLRWQDTHKALGLWGLPFSSMIATTGAVLGLASAISPVALVLAYHGDVAGLEQKLGAAAPSPSSPAPEFAPAMFSVDRLGAMRHPRVKGPVARIQYSNWGTTAAVATLSFPDHDRLGADAKLVLSAISGEVIHERNERSDPSVPARVYGTIKPLHFATFAGTALKFVYAALGSLLCGAIALGNAMWVARRVAGRASQERLPLHRTLARVNLGLCLGLPLATIVVFQADKWLFHEHGSPFGAIAALYGAAAVASVAYALLRPTLKGATTELVRACGACCLALPLTDALHSGSLFWPRSAPWLAPHLWVDAAAFAVGLLLLVLAQRIAWFAASRAGVAHR